MIIRYRGGPLNRQTFTGPSHQPQYRDPDGQAIPYQQARDHVISAVQTRRVPDVYVYDRRQCAYIYFDQLVAECKAIAA